jgi:hypothetical protein
MLLGARSASLTNTKCNGLRRPRKAGLLESLLANRHTSLIVFCSSRLSRHFSTAFVSFRPFLPFFAAPLARMDTLRNFASKATGGSGPKRPRSTSTSTVGSQAPAGSGPATAQASSQAEPLNPQQPKTFAEAAAAATVPAKRPGGPSAPSCPRPALRRGPVLWQSSDYASLERPAPPTAAPNTLYADLRQETMTPEAFLAAAYAFLGNLVIGFQLFAAQKVVALTFASVEAHALHVNVRLGRDGPLLYPAPPNPAELVRLTLQGVPYWHADKLRSAVAGLLDPFGSLVFLAPMVSTDGWMSDQWHATFVRKEGVTELPPDQIELFGLPVIVDIPGQRRFCRHCASSTHYKNTCRQWQRQRSRQAQAAREQQQHDQQYQQPQHHEQQQQEQQQQQQQQSDARRPPVPQNTATNEELWAEAPPRPLPTYTWSPFDDDAMEEVEPAVNPALRAEQIRLAQEIVANPGLHKSEKVVAATAFLTSARAEASGAKQ